MSQWQQILRNPWLPLTPHGVAAFSGAAWTRMAVVLLGAGAGVAAAGVWFLCACWTPVVSEAVRRLPERALVSGGALHWEGDTPARLGENKWLALVVDARDTQLPGRVADLEVTLGAQRLTLASLTGRLPVRYSKTWNTSLSRTDWLPWWEAWRWPILAAAALGIMAAMILCWSLLALLYSPLPHALCSCSERDLTWGGAWRLSVAALMPGVCLLCAGLAGYGLGFLDLIHLAGCYALHLAAGWVFLVISPLCLPRRGRAARNPFGPGSPSAAEGPAGGANPFSGARR